MPANGRGHDPIQSRLGRVNADRVHVVLTSQPLQGCRCRLTGANALGRERFCRDRPSEHLHRGKLKAIRVGHQPKSGRRDLHESSLRAVELKRVRLRIRATRTALFFDHDSPRFTFLADCNGEILWEALARHGAVAARIKHDLSNFAISPQIDDDILRVKPVIRVGGKRFAAPTERAGSAVGEALNRPAVRLQ